MTVIYKRALLSYTQLIQHYTAGRSHLIAKAVTNLAHFFKNVAQLSAVLTLQSERK